VELASAGLRSPDPQVCDARVPGQRESKRHLDSTVMWWSSWTSDGQHEPTCNRNGCAQLIDKWLAIWLIGEFVIHREAASLAFSSQRTSISPEANGMAPLQLARYSAF